MSKDALQSLRMADGEAHIAALDTSAEQPLRERVGQADGAAFDDERRFVERIDEGTYAEQGIRHRQLSSRLIGFGHDLR